MSIQKHRLPPTFQHEKINKKSGKKNVTDDPYHPVRGAHGAVRNLRGRIISCDTMPHYNYMRVVEPINLEPFYRINESEMHVAHSTVACQRGAVAVWRVAGLYRVFGRDTRRRTHSLAWAATNVKERRRYFTEKILLQEKTAKKSYNWRFFLIYRVSILQKVAVSCKNDEIHKH